MEKLFALLIEKSGVILSSNDCSVEAIEAARKEERMFVDDDGFGFIHFTEQQLVEFGGGIKNPKP